MTQLDICNRALAVIGHDRMITSLADGTSESARCAQFYPAAVRNVLGAYNWDFAAREVTVAVPDGAAEWAIPGDLVKLVSVRDDAGRSVRAVRAGGKMCITPDEGVDEVVLRYISSADPEGSTLEATLPHLVAEAVVYELAAQLFAPMTGNVQKQDGTALYQSYLDLAGQRLSAAITAEDAEHAYMGGNRTGESSSRTDIANRALAKLGADAVITDIQTDHTPLAARARLFFNSSVREVLRRRDWDFAAAETAVALAWDDSSGFSRMQLPPDCVRVCRCFDERGNPLECRRNRDYFMVRSGGGKATVRYISSDIALSEAPEEFLDLAAMNLAVKLAPTVLKDARAVAAVTRELEQAVNAAAFEEANETANPGEWRNPLIACRD